MSKVTNKLRDYVENEAVKVKDIIKDDGTQFYSSALDGIKSISYIYPILGLAFLFNHSKILVQMKPLMYKSLIISISVLAFMFVFTYVPQVAILSIVNGPLAVFSVIPLIFIESGTIIAFFNRSLILGQASEKLFDAVLLEKGCKDLVEKGRVVKGGSSGKTLSLGKNLLNSAGNKLGGQFSAQHLVNYLYTLPLTFIPVLGPIIFILFNSKSVGPTYHSRYFQLLDLSPAERDSYISKNQGAYTAFGVTTSLLGMIPIVGEILTFGSIVGAALWSADLEKEKNKGKGANDGESVREEIKEVKLDL